jgi:hypothetical protein
MTLQVTNRIERVSKSCHGRSWKLPAFTLKELETVMAAPVLLGAPTIGGGVPGPGVVVGGVKEVK